MKKSKHAFKFAIGAAILHVSIFYYISIYRYLKLEYPVPSLFDRVGLVMPSGQVIVHIIILFSPLVRGLIAIRDIKREEEQIREPI